MGGDGEIPGVAHRMSVLESCGGMWLKTMREKCEKNVRKWEENGTSEIPIFHGHIFLMFPEVEDRGGGGFLEIGYPA